MPSGSAASGVTLADFLLARIAEDEANAPVSFAFEWRRQGSSDDDWRRDPVPNGVTAEARSYGEPVPDARVLVECEAKRRIVELHDRGHECSIYQHGEIQVCGWVLPGDACSTLRLLALPYADHPDYCEEWRP